MNLVLLPPRATVHRLGDGPMKGGGAGVWTRLREVSCVEGVAMRDLRHYFACSCLSRGIPISTVSAWMGHSEIDLTVKRYGRFAAEAREQWTWAALRAEPVEQVATGSEGRNDPPAGPEYEICAVAAARVGARAYKDFGLKKARDPLRPQDLHPGFLFVTTGALRIHLAH